MWQPMPRVLEGVMGSGGGALGRSGGGGARQSRPRDSSQGRHV